MSHSGLDGLLVRAALAVCAACLLATGAQALMVPLSDADLAAGADEIVHATITKVQSQWNAEKTGVITTATVAVKSRVKGEGPDTFTLTVPGGTADGITHSVEDQPALETGTDAFIFVGRSGTHGATVLGGFQGYVPILEGIVFRNANGTGSSVAADAYEGYLSALVAGVSPTPPPSKIAVRAAGAAAGTPPVITSVSPSIASAGTDSIITITGRGFGTKSSRQSLADVGFTYTPAIPIYASGSPYFSDNANNIVDGSWTDTQIKVKVPIGKTADGYRWGSASSGHLFVRTDAGGISNNYPFTVTFSWGRAFWHGPMQFYINPNPFAPADTMIKNAATTWNAAIPSSSFHIAYFGLDQTSNVARDNRNVVCFLPATAFDNPVSIAEENKWVDTGTGEILESDIRLNLGYSWTTGPGSGTIYNVEAMVLHEFGHAMGLRDLYGYGSSEPADINEVMFGYKDDARGNMNLKTLHPNDIAGARWLYLTGAPLPGCAGPPRDTDGDGLYDDVNGNGRRDFSDIVLYFNQMTWISGNEPVVAFDYNANGRIDFSDVVWLFSHL